MLHLAWPARTLSTAITMIATTLAALFVAQGASYLVAGSLLRAPPVTLFSLPARELSLAPGAQPPDAMAILARNIFDPTVGPLWPRKAPAIEPPIDDPVPGQLPSPCDGSLRLIAAMRVERAPEWSFATLGADANAALYRQGARIDDKQIVEILPQAALLRGDNGKLCSLAMFQDARTPVTPKPASVPEPASAEAALDRGIHARSATSFVIDKRFAESILGDAARIFRSERVVPHEESGRVVGMKVYGIRRASVLARLGLQTGDLLRTVNGFDLSDPTAALDAYARLRNANRLSVAIVRRGSPITLEYDVR